MMQPTFDHNPPTIRRAERDRVDDMPFDAVVIGAGFGGLGAALALAERGARVAVCETLRYPGGCASTFHHGRYRFEAGATLFSGFAEGQLFRRWIDRHHLDIEVEWPEPMVRLRTRGFELTVPRDRDAFVDQVLDLPGAGAREPAIRAFFDHQLEVADALWPLLDDADLLPPFTVGALWRHACRLPAYAPLLRDVGRTLEQVLRRFGLDDFAPLCTYLDAVCRITVQCGLDEAEAPFALSALDYWFRGTGHVRGGIGRLARAMAGAIQDLGGEVRYTDRVRAIRRDPHARGDASDGPGGFVVESRRGVLRARSVVTNLLPHTLPVLLDEDLLAEVDPSGLGRWRDRIEDGWGACMIYRVARAPVGLSPGAHHYELVQDHSRPLIEGNHVFLSVCGADDGHAPPGFRALTASTHVSIRKLKELSEDDQAAYVDDVHERMARTLDRLAPEWSTEVRHHMTASPRTFERFTGRPGGWVGGVPRRAGLAAYLDALRVPRLPRGLHLVGDSAFPGQSTLATALGGAKTARRILADLGLGDGVPRARPVPRPERLSEPSPEPIALRQAGRLGHGGRSGRSRRGGRGALADTPVAE